MCECVCNCITAVPVKSLGLPEPGLLGTLAGILQATRITYGGDATHETVYM